MMRVYCDFDGTVCINDVGEQFFHHFLENKADELLEPLLEGTITGKELLLRECEALPPLYENNVKEYIAQFSIDPTFPSFVNFCKSSNIPLTIVSDGLDLYVEQILERENLSYLPVFANHGYFNAEGSTSRLLVTFPYTDEECNECGNCKRNHMLAQSADEDIIVYVGDGYSDRCPVQYADIVFAKRSLIPYCQKKNITYFEFQNFADVKEKIEQLLQRRRLKHRREAAVARKQVFMQG